MKRIPFLLFSVLALGLAPSTAQTDTERPGPPTARIDSGPRGLSPAEELELSAALSPSDVSSITRGSVGVARADGRTWGLGPDYKCAFRAGGIEFTPALGPGAPRNLPLGYRLESVSRGGALHFSASGASAPVAGDTEVRYGHPGGVVERYELRREGVEQSFVFPEPPPGAGELVVRGRLQTCLLYTSPSPRDQRGSRMPSSA